MDAVADAGPLIHLAQLGALHTLSIFERIHIPGAVWSESQAHGADLARTSGLPDLVAHRVNAHDVQSFVQDHALAHLQQGEIEGLLLCRLGGFNILLTDDLAARNAAKQLGIVAVGSLGIVVRACHEGLVDVVVARSLLVGLFDRSSLFVTRALVDLAIERLTGDGRSHQ